MPENSSYDDVDPTQSLTILSDLENGECVRSLSLALFEGALATKANLGKSTITLKIDVSLKDDNQLKLDYSIKTKPSPRITEPTTFFIDKKNNFKKNDPNQADIFGADPLHN